MPHPLAFHDQLADQGYHAKSLGQFSQRTHAKSSVRVANVVASTYDIYHPLKSIDDRMVLYAPLTFSCKPGNLELEI